MTTLAELMKTPSAKALGSTLFHFLWEGVGIALLLALALTVARPSRIRYALACVAMVAMPVVFGITLALSMPEAASRFAVTSAPALASTQPAAIGSNGGVSLQAIEDSMRLFIPFWLAGLLFFYFRSMAGWVAVQRLRRDGVCAPPIVWQNRLSTLAARLGIDRAVSLLESSRVDVPVVVGFLRPVIMLPVGLLSGMPVEQLEYILIHELAHIRRFDYAINLLQKAVEGLLFYHPAVWWISSVLRAERENCCDDTVLAECGDARAYAATLAALEHGRLPLVMAATGGSLAKRVRRILTRTPRAPETPLISCALLIATCMVAFVGFQSPVHLAAQQDSNRFDRWLHEDVTYIITNAERAEFKRLGSDTERETFIEQFWQRRGQDFKTEHYRRIGYANTRFTSGLPGWKTDQGRIYITFGPPDEIDSHPAGQVPYEEWLYRHIDGIGDNVMIRFEKRDGKYQMTSDPGQP